MNFYYVLKTERNLKETTTFTKCSKCACFFGVLDGRCAHTKQASVDEYFPANKYNTQMSFSHLYDINGKYFVCESHTHTSLSGVCIVNFCEFVCGQS